MLISANLHTRMPGQALRAGATSRTRVRGNAPNDFGHRRPGQTRISTVRQYRGQLADRPKRDNL
ncbi:MAG: hypothetical protein K0U93_17600, partial [Gammaproteobacteria bacterium]|nr:hypothetical protein [Gammaproteobacteria bacterium]